MATVLPLSSPKDDRAESLGDQITELYGYITAATYELLVKIRAFDEQKLLEQAGLLMIARHGTAHHVETVVRGYRRDCRMNDAQIAEAQHEQRAFHCHWDEDG